MLLLFGQPCIAIGQLCMKACTAAVFIGAVCAVICAVTWPRHDAFTIVTFVHVERTNYNRCSPSLRHALQAAAAMFRN